MPPADPRISAHFSEAASTLESFRSDPANLEAVERAAGLMVASLKQGGKLISCGNGGSMCDAMHFAEELTGKVRNGRAPIAPGTGVSAPLAMATEQAETDESAGVPAPAPLGTALMPAGPRPSRKR